VARTTEAIAAAKMYIKCMVVGVWDQGVVVYGIWVEASMGWVASSLIDHFRIASCFILGLNRGREQTSVKFVAVEEKDHPHATHMCATGLFPRRVESSRRAEIHRAMLKAKGSICPNRGKLKLISTHCAHRRQVNANDKLSRFDGNDGRMDT